MNVKGSSDVLHLGYDGRAGGHCDAGVLAARRGEALRQDFDLNIS